MNVDQNVTDRKQQTPQLHMVAASHSMDVLQKFASQTFPENIISTLSFNKSRMFPGAVFSGQPGMLGIGLQVPLETITPDHIPMPESQYLPAQLRNVSETMLSVPVYSGYPGMLGIGQQQAASVGNDEYANTPSPSYSMSEFGQMHSNDLPDARVATHMNGQVSVHSNSIQTGYHNGGTESLPRVNTNNWNGEWPGMCISL